MDNTQDKYEPQNPPKQRAGGGGLSFPVRIAKSEPPPLAASHPAIQMIEAFASVGVATFDISFTDQYEHATGFRPKQSVGQIRSSLPHFVARAEQDRNVILRPGLPLERGVLVQLDDVGDPAMQNRLAPLAFLTIETSLGNRQFWVVISDPEPDTRRRIKRGAGADAHASGAVRLAGTANRKPKYAPTYPMVAIVEVQQGRTVTRAQVEAVGLLPVIPESAPPVVSSRRAGPLRRWPSYARVLQGAPRGGDLGEQRYAADFTFAMTCIDWGWSPEETAARLMQESSKAQENGEVYAERTAKSAAAAVERRRAKQLG